MKYIENVSIEQMTLIVDKIISFIKENKSYDIDDKKLKFNDNGISYTVYKNILIDEISSIIVCNYSKEISVIFDISNIKDINKYNFINSNILPIILNYNKPLNNDEFFETFNMSPDIKIERSNKVSKILKKIFNI